MNRQFFALALLASLAAGVACATATSTTSSGTGGDASSASSTSASVTSSAQASSSSGAGGCTVAADCVGVGDACNAGNCVNGKCVKVPANDNLACDDGLFCTDNETCTNGVCGSGSSHFCPPTDACHIGQCNEMNKACDQLPGNDGAMCDDNDACTQLGVCLGGVCSKGPPVDCSFFDGPCAIGVCDPVLGCQPMPLNDGAACDDGLYCTINDSCQQGNCTGAPNPCVPANDVCHIANCDEASKSCIIVPGNDGMACDDLNACTSGEKCSAGTCAGGAPANNGGACDDHIGCTTGDACSNGTCSGSAITMCADNDGCCPAGCVLATDNDCQCNINQALTATPQISGGGTIAPYTKSNINDGVGKSCNQFAWISDNVQPSGAWAELDWPNAVSIGSFYIETENPSNPMCGSVGRNIDSATVQWWNGNAWVNAGSFSGKQGDVQFDINPPVSTTKLRIFDMTVSNVPNPNGNSIIWEWHVYAAPGCVPPP